MRLALGTVQFGMNYGISNHTGQVCLDTAAQILKQAYMSGINTLDTAIGYGESEKNLGQIGVHQWQVVSKLPAIPQTCKNIHSWVKTETLASLTRLQINKLYGLLLHKPSQLLTCEGNDFYQTLLMLKEQNIVDKIGISVYEPQELNEIVSKFAFDIVQMPFNVVDRRFFSSFSKLKQLGIEIHVRSAFLQGLLLMTEQNRPAKFQRWDLLWKKWHTWLSEQGLTPLKACLNFVLSHKEIDKVVVGVDNLIHLQQILDVDTNPLINYDIALSTEDIQLLNPSNWMMI